MARCHVGDSNRKVIKYVISRMAHKYATFHALTPKVRKIFLRAVIDCHRNNRGLYTFVMRGH